jgi:hypothetical protein
MVVTGVGVPPGLHRAIDCEAPDGGLAGLAFGRCRGTLGRLAIGLAP